MSKNCSEQLNKMKYLINYGNVNENKENTGGITSRIEYSAKGADGKTYGIIRECNKFYIKVAPPKNSEIIAEDFDYIGGYMNKKENEYSTYALASKQFDLKMMAMNEVYDIKNKKPVTQFKEQEESDWQINETKEMRSELNRYNQLLNHMNAILTEEKKGVTVNHMEVPEAPASHPSQKQVNSPFTDTAVAKGDKEFTQTSTDHKKAGAPFNKDGKATNKDMQSDKMPSGNSDSTYGESAKYVPEDSVANKKPAGGKVVKVNEGKKVFKLTEEQVLAWNKNKDYMDKSSGTEIGSSAPYGDEVGTESNQTEANTESIHEDTVAHNTDNQNTPAPHVGEVGDTAPYDNNVNEDIVDVDDVEGMEMDDVPFPEVEDGGAYLDFEKGYNDFEENGGFDDMDDDNLFNDDAAAAAQGDMELEFDFDDDFDEHFDESVRRRTNEAELHDFGKHPAYRKKPMKLPPNVDIAPNGARDWNDDSVKSEKPFGSKIGSSAPFSEKVLNMLTDAIVEELGFKKKV